MNEQDNALIQALLALGPLLGGGTVIYLLRKAWPVILDAAIGLVASFANRSASKSSNSNTAISDTLSLVVSSFTTQMRDVLREDMEDRQQYIDRLARVEVQVNTLSAQVTSQAQLIKDLEQEREHLRNELRKANSRINYLVSRLKKMGVDTEMILTEMDT